MDNRDNGVVLTLALQNPSETSVHNNDPPSLRAFISKDSERAQSILHNQPKQARLGVANSRKMNLGATKDFTNIESFINQFGSDQCALFGDDESQEPIELVSSTAGIQSSRPALSSALLTADAKYDKFLQPSNKTFGSVCGKIFDGPWSGFSGPLSPNSNFNVDDLFGSPNNNDSEKKSLIKSTIDGTSAASQRERSIFNFASAKQSKHPDFSFENSFPAPQQPAITHAPLEDNTINLKASSGHYTPTCTSNAGSFASISFGFSNTKPAKTSPNKTFSHPGQRQTKQTGDGPTDYNPLLMRGPGASIFKGTCKWYNSQRGFGFIIPDSTKLMLGDVFVHHTVIYAKGFRSLNTGEHLEFTVIQKEGKWHATSVTGPNGSHVEGASKSGRNKGSCEHKAAMGSELDVHGDYLANNSIAAETVATSSATHKAMSTQTMWTDTTLSTQKHKQKSTQDGSVALPGSDTADYNPLKMRGPHAKIFNGICKWYNSQRGFGFIIPKDNELMFGDVFVHHTVIHADGFRSLNTGEHLEFTVIQKEGKWHATSVTGPNGSHVEGLNQSKSAKGGRQHGDSTMMAGSKNNSTKSNPDSNHPDNNKSSTPRAPKTSGFHNVWSTSAGPNGFVGGLFGGGAVSGHSDAASANFNPSTFKRDPDAKIYNGTCKWYNSQRGFGFIIPDDMALNFGDVFVHHTVILSKGFRSLNAGERLEFTVISKDGKWHATSVTGPDGQPVQGFTQKHSAKPSFTDAFQPRKNLIGGVTEFQLSSMTNYGADFSSEVGPSSDRQSLHM